MPEPTLPALNTVEGVVQFSIKEGVSDTFNKMGGFSRVVVNQEALETKYPQGAIAIADFNCQEFQSFLTVNFEPPDAAKFLSKVFNENVSQDSPMLSDGMTEVVNVLLAYFKRNFAPFSYRFNLSNFQVFSSAEQWKLPANIVFEKTLSFSAVCPSEFNFYFQFHFVKQVFETLAPAASNKDVQESRKLQNIKIDLLGNEPKGTYFIEGYLPFEIKDIVADREINFDVFMLMPKNQKLYLFKKKTENFDKATIEKFKSSKYTVFYIANRDNLEK